MTNYESIITGITPEKLAQAIIRHCSFCAYSREHNPKRKRWDLCPVNCEAGVLEYLNAPYIPSEEDS
jgi:hypothetical protein